MYTVVAYQVASNINLKLSQELLDVKSIFQDSDEAFYSIKENSYIYIFQFGMISFFGLSELEVEKIITKIKSACSNFFLEKIEEKSTIEIKPNQLKVEFNSVILPKLDSEMIRLVMLYTSQSVALNRYGDITESLLKETTKHTKYLELKGKLDISGYKLKRFIGRTLNIKNGILENLYIFDSPDITWDNEDLNNLDKSLKLSFDLKDRYRRLNDRIEIIKENLELFKDIMEHAESSKLEWIIIILILVEVIDMLIVKFM